MLDSVLKWGVSSGWSFGPGSSEATTIRKPTTVFFLKFNTAPELEISDQLKNRLFLSYFIVKIDFHVQILQSTVAMFTVEQS